MNPAQVIADLRAAGRTPQLPVRLEMQAGDVLVLERPLRLVPGKVEVSGDNRSFRPLAEQAQNCSISPIG